MLLAPLTSTSRSLLLGTGWDSIRFGRRTAATADDVSIRFRIEHPPTGLEFVPDTVRAAHLLASPAGQPMIEALRNGLQIVNRHRGEHALRGISLVPDRSSMAFGLAVGEIEQGIVAAPDQGLASALYAGMRDTRPFAVNDYGWVTYSPEMSRSMLASVGAYRPHDELERASLLALRHRNGGRFLDDASAHEGVHSIGKESEATYERLAKVEESLAELLSRARYDPSRRAPSAWPPAEQSLGRHRELDPRALRATAGWSRSVPTARQVAQDDARIQRHEAEQVELATLLREYAGIDVANPAGYRRAEHVLLDKSLRYVPGSLADAILDQQKHLPGSRREPLRAALARWTFDAEGTRALAQQFGLRPAREHAA